MCPRAGGHHGRRDQALGKLDSNARRLPRPPGDRRGLWRQRRARRSGDARQDVGNQASREGNLRRPSVADAGNALPLPRDRAAEFPELSRDHRRGGRRLQGDPRPPTQNAPGIRCAVPSRVRHDSGWKTTAPQLPRPDPRLMLRGLLLVAALASGFSVPPVVVRDPGPGPVGRYLADVLAAPTTRVLVGDTVRVSPDSTYPASLAILAKRE